MKNMYTYSSKTEQDNIMLYITSRDLEFGDCFPQRGIRPDPTKESLVYDGKQNSVGSFQL